MNPDSYRLMDARIRIDPCAAVANFRMYNVAFRMLISVAMLLGFARSVSADDRVKLPDGFGLTQVATDELATNIFCMIALPDGGALVSGPGYINKLIDDDDDGVFDRVERVSDFPKSGAQGLAVDGVDLLCVGDGGIWRLPDVLEINENARDTAKAPECLFEISTRGEHHAHSIQKGPDGWWYHIAGNHAAFDQQHCKGPIKNRRAGVVMRFSPDFSQREIMAHGFRNAYDFAFNSTDQLFTFDSDGERDLGLPWYRPTRVFEIVPGDDAGWVSKTWKRPSYYFDMPRLIGDAARASPTGVACYDGNQFPLEYDDAIFLGDWTFGRVLVCRRVWKTGEYLPPEEFLTPKASFGFPVTDLAVAHDGSLLISVGGRGTEGGVWRVTSKTKRKQTEESLGKYVWERRQAFRQNLPTEGLIERASKMLDQKDRDLQVDALAGLLVHTQSFSVDRFGAEVSDLLVKACQSDDPKVFAATLRFAKALCRRDDRWESLLVSNGKSLTENARVFILAKLASQPSDPERRALFDYLLSPATFGNGVDSENSFPDDIAWRLAQLLLGGVGDSGGFFSSTTATKPIKRSKIQGRESHGLVFHAIENTKFHTARLELARLLAMEHAPAGLASQFFLQHVGFDTGKDYGMGLPFDETNNFGDLVSFARTGPSQDLHWLMCLLQLEATENEGIDEQLANVLLHIQKKFLTQNVQTDSHFRPMLDQLASRAFDKYPGLSKRLLKAEHFGASHHGFLFSKFSDEELPLLQEKVMTWMQGKSSVRVTVDHVAVLDRNPTSKTVGVLRDMAKDASLKDTVTMALAKHGDATDRELFVEGLQSLDPRVQRESAIALRKRVPDVSPDAAVAALRAAMRLGNEEQDVSIRDQLILLLRKFSSKDFGYQLQRPDLRQGDVLLRWRAFLIEQQPEVAEFLKPAESGQQLMARLEQLDWESGDASRGKRVHEKLQCAACHGASRTLGPRLEGVTRRLGRTDLLTAIVTPDAQVSDRYRTTLFETVDGQLFSGSIVYENVDGVTIRESSGQTRRLNRDQIENQRRSTKSLMPTGLLDRATNQEVTDLMAFLKTL